MAPTHSKPAPLDEDEVIDFLCSSNADFAKGNQTVLEYMCKAKFLTGLSPELLPAAKRQLSELRKEHASSWNLTEEEENHIEQRAKKGKPHVEEHGLGRSLEFIRELAQEIYAELTNKKRDAVRTIKQIAMFMIGIFSDYAKTPIGKMTRQEKTKVADDLTKAISQCRTPPGLFYLYVTDYGARTLPLLIECRGVEKIGLANERALWRELMWRCLSFIPRKYFVFMHIPVPFQIYHAEGEMEAKHLRWAEGESWTVTRWRNIIYRPLDREECEDAFDAAFKHDALSEKDKEILNVEGSVAWMQLPLRGLQNTQNDSVKPDEVSGLTDGGQGSVAESSRAQGAGRRGKPIAGGQGKATKRPRGGNRGRKRKLQAQSADGQAKATKRPRGGNRGRKSKRKQQNGH